MINELFLKIQERSKVSQYTVNLSVLEIYNEQLRDLLSQDDFANSDGYIFHLKRIPKNSRKLEIKLNTNGSTYIPDLKYFPAKSVQEAWSLMSSGFKNRATGVTDCNEHSSRSHSLVILTINGEDLQTGVRTYSKLSLVDLAGYPSNYQLFTYTTFKIGEVRKN
jgi:kinesin family protein C2/C3